MSRGKGCSGTGVRSRRPAGRCPGVQGPPLQPTQGQDAQSTLSVPPRIHTNSYLPRLTHADTEQLPCPSIVLVDAENSAVGHMSTQHGSPEWFHSKTHVPVPYIYNVGVRYILVDQTEFGALGRELLVGFSACKSTCSFSALDDAESIS